MTPDHTFRITKATRVLRRIILHLGKFFSNRGTRLRLFPPTMPSALIGTPRRHKKTSVFCQMADLVLYPIARAKYDPQYRPFQFLKHAGKLVVCVVLSDEIELLGTKYSCFD